MSDAQRAGSGNRIHAGESTPNQQFTQMAATCGVGLAWRVRLCSRKNRDIYIEPMCPDASEIFPLPHFLGTRHLSQLEHVLLRGVRVSEIHTTYLSRGPERQSK